LDTLGDLAAFYTIATVAVIGGSFYPGVEGHNPIEAAAAGAPVVFGPYMRNFLDASDVLTAAGGALQVGRPEDLSAALAELLRDESACAAMGEKAKSAVTANQGATERTLDLIEPFVCPNASPEASK
jgi:3-deoxy-D-manno-octulosonic-acid transferase